MSTALLTPDLRRVGPRPLTRADVPPLENGDRLDAAEFMRRYRVTPGNAELINGIVYMASPVSARRHGRPHSMLTMWLGHYVIVVPQLEVFDNSTTELDDENRPQPDLALRIPESLGGTSRITDDDYLAGPPELLLEVASSSVNIDLHAKLETYRDNGVGEYLVWRTRDAAVDWFVLEGGRYEPIPPDPADGLLKSRTFPGLWLNPPALLAHDLPALAAAVARGRDTPEHAAFAARLAAGPTPAGPA